MNKEIIPTDDSPSLEQSKNKGLKKPAEFKVGSTDLQGRKIVHVYFTGVDYVVYRTSQGIKVYIYDDYLPKEERLLWDNYLKIGKKLGHVYSLQPEQLSWVESINKTIARAIQQSVEGNFDEANELLDDAELRLIRLRCLQGRLEYLFSAGAAVLLFALLLTAALLLSTRDLITDDILMLFKISACGALGGFLSVSLNVWKLDIDLDANRIINCSAGGSRIIIAVFAAIFAYFAVMSELILGTLSKTVYGLYIASMVAGFSEKFIPNIIRTISKEEKGQDIDRSISCKK